MSPAESDDESHCEENFASEIASKTHAKDFDAFEFRIGSVRHLCRLISPAITLFFKHY